MIPNGAMIEGADILLCECGRLQPGESVLIVCDERTQPIGALLHARATGMGAAARLMETPSAHMHGVEPTEEVAEAMARAALCLGVTAKSMAHTKARQMLSAHGGRYLSLPDYSLALLADASLRVRFRDKGPLARAVADLFTNGLSIRVTSKRGTDVVMRTDDRRGNCCPGCVDAPGTMGSPPDIEANISPIETSAEGTIVVDGSIPYPTIGLLAHPITLQVRGGHIVAIDGDEATCATLRRVFASAGSKKAYVLAECGVGLNDRAQLNGTMLVDEGTLGTVHLGFGSNATVGGTNDVGFHLDCVLRDPSVIVDDFFLLRDGALCL